MSETTATQPAAVARVGTVCYTTEIETGGHRLTADEPRDHDGQDAGPTPFDLLYSALAACICTSIRHYATRKGLALASAEARVFPQRERGHPLTSVRVELTLTGDLSEQDRVRLHRMAAGCLVHRTLEHGAAVAIELIE